MDWSGLIHHIGKVMYGPIVHVLIMLLGIFKGGAGIQHYLQAAVNDIESRLKVRW